MTLDGGRMSDTLLVLTGSINRTAEGGVAARGEGISVLRLDPSSGALLAVSVSGRIDNPTFVVPDADRGTLYVTSEVDSWDEGLVSAYRLDAATGHLLYINKQPTRGGAPAYLSVHPGGGWLFAANYLVDAQVSRPAQAVAVFPIEADGGVGPAVASASHHGSGPVPGRQDAPHPHCALASPDGRFVLVADLGLDQIVVYPFDVSTGALGPGVAVALAPGCGPRHLAFAGERWLIAVGELDSTVRALAWDAGEGSLRPVACRSLLPAGWCHEASGADVAVSADARFVYVSTRGADVVVTLALDGEHGALTVLAHDVTPAKPRSLTLAGDCLLVAGQDGDSVAVFRRDMASGRLTDAGQRAAVGCPTCVRAMPAGHDDDVEPIAGSTAA